MAHEDGPVEHLFDRLAFRWANYDTPFWARPNSLAGRWNSVGTGPTQYWCLDPHGPWAELIRHEELHTDADLAMVRQSVWIARWSTGPLADMSTFEKGEEWGVTPEILVEDDHQRCRRLANALRARGLAGVMCPSAALPYTTSLVVFGPRILAAWGSHPRLASGVPALQWGIGSPPSGLHERVRHYGDRHSELDEYRRLARRIRARRRRED
jgi:hypothetical protein